jgi:hypothetical protein
MEVLIAQIKEQWTFWSLSRGGGEKEWIQVSLGVVFSTAVVRNETVNLLKLFFSYSQGSTFPVRLHNNETTSIL